MVDGESVDHVCEEGIVGESTDEQINTALTPELDFVEDVEAAAGKPSTAGQGARAPVGIAEMDVEDLGLAARV